MGTIQRFPYFAHTLTRFRMKLKDRTAYRESAALLEDFQKTFAQKILLCEGVDIVTSPTTGKRAVKYNPTHQDLVDTSEDNNPIRYDIFKDVPVWSIFKRKKSPVRKGDGNPLLYAFKNERGWDFASPYDEFLFKRQITKILTKFRELHEGGTTILLPSTHSLNQMVADLYKKTDPSVLLIKGVLHKSSIEQVFDACDSPNSLFCKHYGLESEDKLEELSEYLNGMEDKNNGYFSYHDIPDMEMREVIENSMYMEPDAYAKFGKQINRRNILLIDDSITLGKSLSEAILLLRSTFVPKSITILTLFSPLADK